MEDILDQLGVQLPEKEHGIPLSYSVSDSFKLKLPEMDEIMTSPTERRRSELSDFY